MKKINKFWIAVILICGVFIIFGGILMVKQCYITSYPLVFEMSICSTNDDLAYISVDALVENSVFDPLQYRGKIYFNGIEYVDHETRLFSAKRSLADRIAAKVKGDFYNDFFQADTYGISNRIEINVLHNEESDSYFVWLSYIDYENNNRTEYFGPSTSQKTSKEIEDKFHLYCSNTLRCIDCYSCFGI